MAKCGGSVKFAAQQTTKPASQFMLGRLQNGRIASTHHQAGDSGVIRACCRIKPGVTQPRLAARLCLE